MKIETYFDVILKGESCFWIFTRSLDELNKFSLISQNNIFLLFPKNSSPIIKLSILTTLNHFFLQFLMNLTF